MPGKTLNLSIRLISRSGKGMTLIFISGCKFHFANLDLLPKGNIRLISYLSVNPVCLAKLSIILNNSLAMPLGLSPRSGTASMNSFCLGDFAMQFNVDVRIYQIRSLAFFEYIKDGRFFPPIGNFGAIVIDKCWIK